MSGAEVPFQLVGVLVAVLDADILLLSTRSYIGDRLLLGLLLYRLLRAFGLLHHCQSLRRLAGHAGELDRPILQSTGSTMFVFLPKPETCWDCNCCDTLLAIVLVW